MVKTHAWDLRLIYVGLHASLYNMSVCQQWTDKCLAFRISDDSVHSMIPLSSKLISGEFLQALVCPLSPEHKWSVSISNFQFSFKAVLSRNCEPWFLACGGYCSSGSTEHGPVHTYTSNPLLPDVEHKILFSLLCVSWKSFSSYWHSQKDWWWNIAHLNPL